MPARGRPGSGCYSPLRFVGSGGVFKALSYGLAGGVSSLNRQVDANLERLELAAEAAGIGFWEWDLLADRLVPDGFLSARFGIGLRSGCAPAEEFEQLLHPDDLAGFLSALGRAFKSSERTHHRCRMHHLDGSVRFIDV